MSKSPDITIGLSGALAGVHSVRLAQDLFNHDALEMVTSLDQLPNEAVLLRSPQKILGESLSWRIGDSWTWNGLIVAATSSLDSGSGAVVRITAKAPTLLLENGPGARSFDENMELDALVSAVLKPYTSGRLLERTGKVGKHAIPFPVQYRESDFAFLSRLCSQHGEWLFWTGDHLHVGERNGKPMELVAKRDLKSVESSFRVQPRGYKAWTRDYLADQVHSCSTKELRGKPGGFEEELLSISESMMCSIPLRSSGSRAPHGDENWLRQTSETDRLAATKGLFTIAATSTNSLLSLGKSITIKYPPRRDSEKREPYDGELVIVRAVHEMSSRGAYQNYIEAVPVGTGLPPSDIGTIPIRAQLDTAVVVDNKDPEKIGRVKVRFYWQEEKQSTPWIRTAAPHAGKDRGVFFVPEKNEEVLVGFEDGNPERPVVLGSLYHGNAQPGCWNQDDNLKKGIRTTSGNELLFFDERGRERIEVRTKNGEGVVSVSVENNGTVKIEGTKVSIEAAGELKLKGPRIEIAADGDVSIKGSVIKLN